MTGFHGADPPGLGAGVLEGRGICLRFGGLLALEDVDIMLREGTVTGLIGPNGAGKSSLVNVLSGLTPPTRGDVVFRGRKTIRWSLGSAARAGVTRSFQATRAFFDRTVLENLVASSVHAHRRVAPGDLLDLLDLAEHAHAPSAGLSYGQKRRLGVAIALASDPDVVLLDEPGAGLSLGDLDALTVAIHRIRDAGKTVLLVDHNMRFLMSCVERVTVLEGGRTICEGPPQSVQRDPQVRAAYLGGVADA